MPGPRGLVIAIDGVVGAGKSTAARGVAEALRYRHLDTGAMYRAVALAAMEREIAPADDDGVSRMLAALCIELLPLDEGGRILIDGDDVSDAIRRPEVTRRVGAYADRPLVRQRLVEHQRLLGADGGVVAEGRDMSSVVFPDADLKIRMLADLEERSRRRHLEFTRRGIDMSLEQVRHDIRERDREDEERDYGAPASAAAVVDVDTTGLGPDEVVARIVALARRRGA